MYLFGNLNEELDGDYNGSANDNDKKLSFFYALAMFNAMHRF